MIGAKNAAVRKLEHELGITDVKTDDLQFLTRMHYKALQGDDKWGEHESEYEMFQTLLTTVTEASFVIDFLAVLCRDYFYEQISFLTAN